MFLLSIINSPAIAFENDKKHLNGKENMNNKYLPLLKLSINL